VGVAHPTKLANGANVNTKDKRGLTALMWAEKYGHIWIVDLLKEFGAGE
jgi:ankyrin repeat protein